ncbi:MAG TPA: helix-turn-helix transcriptional regulator [Gammaproteobacteria bacterium]|nr:helix-turn-helix transcriptional regulator [Gammaproteobacteria bacterium]
MRITNATEFGKLIREARKKAGLTQADLAAASGVGERFVRELEKGKPGCQIEKALFVAEMLGIKIEMSLPVTGRDHG